MFWFEMKMPSLRDVSGTRMRSASVRLRNIWKTSRFIERESASLYGILNRAAISSVEYF